ncbi:MAG: flavin reductase family protein [Christensenellales bacterium]
MVSFENMEKPLESLLTTGGFLCAKDNVMTISWGMTGVLWRKKVFLAVVRKSRYSHELIEQTKIFTISVPKQGEFKDAIGICGKLSGKDGSKWEKAGLMSKKAKSVDGVVVDGCEKYFECKVITKLDMGNCDLSQIGSFYADGDMHDFYFAEIVEEY